MNETRPLQPFEAMYMRARDNYYALLKQIESYQLESQRLREAIVRLAYMSDDPQEKIKLVSSEMGIDVMKLIRGE